MATVFGDDLVVEVLISTGPDVYAPVNDINRFSRATSRSTQRQRVFMKARPYVNRGQREWTATLSGFLNGSDAGQSALRTAMNTDVPVTLRILPEGTNGFSQQFYVNNQTADANPDPQAMQEAAWELADAGDPVAVGTGPIL